MPIRKKTWGTGITQREGESYVFPLTKDEGRELIKTLREMARGLDLNLILSDIEATATKILGDHVHAAERPERDSRHGYAKRALASVGWVKRSRSRGEMDLAILEAMQLAKLLTEAEFKDQYERPILSWVRWFEAQSRGGRPAGQNDRRDKELATEYLERKETSHLSPTRLKESIGKRRGLARTTAIDAINRGLKILSV